MNQGQKVRSKMQSATASRRSKGSIAKAVLVLLMHQSTGTIGVLVVALLLTGFAFDVLRWFGWSFPINYSNWVLIGTPYFPVQIVVGLILGSLLGRRFQHRSMLWVWVLPFMFLCYLLIALPTPDASAARNSRFSHFFGWGCRPENRCFDQVGATAPFYVSAAYSIGALLARRRPQKPA